MSQSSDANSRGKNRRKWSIMEEELALDFILELKGDPQWKCEGGFKAGFFKQLESMFEKKFPGIGLKASQIEAKVKFLKEKYSVIHETTKLSGFSWDENTNMINCEKQAYLDFCKMHTRAKGLYQVSFPLFNKLDLIFGPDRATGGNSENVEDMVNNMDNECIDLDTDEQLQDDYPRYSSPEAITRPPASKRRKLGKSPLGLTRDNASEKIVIAIEDIRGHLGSIVKTLEKGENREEYNSQQRKLLLSEISMLGFSDIDAIDATSLLVKSPSELDAFYSCPNDAWKKLYVERLLARFHGNIAKSQGFGSSGVTHD